MYNLVKNDAVHFILELAQTFYNTCIINYLPAKSVLLA